MKAQRLGLVAAFRAVAVVKTPARRALMPRTIETYLLWVRKFYQFNECRPASVWTGLDVQRFLWWMHAERYAIKSRKQALCALVYVFRHVLQVDVGKLDLPSMPKEKATIKIIPSRAEIARLFTGLRGQAKLMAGLMYGAGLRVSECCELRVKDIDLELKTIRVHGGKGDKDRLALLPHSMVAALAAHLAWRAGLHDCDCANGAGIAPMPGRMNIKKPSAARSLAWQYLFPSTMIRGQRRWHTVPAAVQKALRAAVKAAGILKPVTPHTLRHAYCTHSLRAGNDPATVQRLMGHDDLTTTMIYAHGDFARGVSPMDVADVAIQRRGISFDLQPA